MRSTKTIAGFGLLVALECLAQVPYHNSLTWRANQWVSSSSVSTDMKYVFATPSSDSTYSKSDDGTNWTVVALTNTPIHTSLNGYYLNGKFHIISSDGVGCWKSITSTNWLYGTLAVNGAYMNVTYGNGIYVAALHNSTHVPVSADGLAWADINGLTFWGGITYPHVTFGGGKFAFFTGTKTGEANATDNYALSVDGTNWFEMTMPQSRQWCSADYGNGTFVAFPGVTNLASPPLQSQSCFWSTDATNWTEVTLPVAAFWNSVFFGHGLFLGVPYQFSGSIPNNYATNIIVVSQYGTNWARMNLPSNRNWYGATYAYDRYFCIAAGSTAAVSMDGTNWGEITIVGNWNYVIGKP